MKRIVVVGTALMLTAALAACGRDDYAQVAPQAQVVTAPAVQGQPPVVYAQPPVVVQQAPAHDGFLMGMLMGHLMSGGGGGGCCHSNNSSHTTVVKNVTVNRTYVRPTRSYSSYRSSSSFRSGGFRRR